MNRDAISLCRLAAETDEETRESAVAALEDFGPPPLSDLPALIELLRTASCDTAYWSATLLGRLGPAAAPAVESLAAALTANRDLPVRERAAWALGEIGPAAAAAAPALQAAAAGTNARLTRLAKQSLERITAT